MDNKNIIKASRGIIPIECILKGRDFEEVISICEDSTEEAMRVTGKEFPIALSFAIYRLYLLGVEDGMNAAGEKE